MSTPAAKSRMKKIFKLLSPHPIQEENNAESSTFETFTLDPFDLTESNNFEFESILPDMSSISLFNTCDADLRPDQNTNHNDLTLPQTKFLVDYSDSDSNNSYTLIDLDNELKIGDNLINSDHTTLVDPILPTFVQNVYEIQPESSLQSDQLKKDLSMMSNDCFETDSEDSWKPDSVCHDSDQESAQQIEEETSVGQRGHRKKRTMPKRLLAKKKRQVNKSVQPNPCINKKCGNSCAFKLSENDRLIIFENYWGLGSDKRQKYFLLSCAKAKPISRKRASSNIRKTSYDYSLNYNGQNIKICQQFLLKTLNISQMTLRYTIENASNILNTTRGDRRSLPHNKSDPEKVAHLKSFIEMLPAVPSHYCRNKSTKIYLPQEFQNITTLYKIYADHLKEKNLQSSILSKRIFRSIFKTDFNIGFHLPKKDKCIYCEKFKNLAPENKIVFQQSIEYKNHIQDKEKCKQLFLEDQKLSKETNSSSICVSFDLQKVLNTPHGKSVSFYYSRKYSFYNESIYESGTRAGYCFLWGECQGKRGCNEIVSIIFQYLSLLDKKDTHSIVNLYADSCAGQNRNRAMISMLIYFLKTTTTITQIKLTYLLPGHTMMPVDSIHSAIESFVRNKTVWAPSEWPTMITNARTNPTGYNVSVLNHQDFLEWKSFSQALLPPKCKINFKSLRVVNFNKNNPVITFQYGFFENSAKHEVNLDFLIRSRANSAIVRKGPTLLYNQELKISTAKYKDLENLCTKSIIPNRYHHEYFNMKYDGEIPDILEESEEENNDKEN